MKYFISGGTGFIGSNLARKLIRNKNKVIIYDNNFRGKKNRLDNINNNLEIFTGDSRDTDKVIYASKSCDFFIHLTAINGTSNFYLMPEKVIDVGVKSLFSAIDACKKNKIKNLVIASSSEVYQLPNTIPTPEKIEVKIPDISNPRYSYGASKIISEIIGMHYGKDFFKRVMIFRPHNVYGPDMGNEHVIPQIISKIIKSINSHKKSKRVPISINGNGQQTRSFIYIDDFIDGLLLVMKKGVDRNVYHIGKNEEIKIINLIKKIFEIFDKKPIIKFGKNILGETPRRCPDISKICKLGFKSNFTLTKGLKNTVKWYKDNI